VKEQGSQAIGKMVARLIGHRNALKGGGRRNSGPWEKDDERRSRNRREICQPHRGRRERRAQAKGQSELGAPAAEARPRSDVTAIRRQPDRHRGSAGPGNQDGIDRPPQADAFRDQRLVRPARPTSLVTSFIFYTSLLVGFVVSCRENEARGRRMSASAATEHEQQRGPRPNPAPGAQLVQPADAPPRSGRARPASFFFRGRWEKKNGAGNASRFPGIAKVPFAFRSASTVDLGGWLDLSPPSTGETTPATP